MAEISEHAKALLMVRFQWPIITTRLCSLRSRLQEIEATEAKYEAAQKSCEVPELAKVAAALCCMCLAGNGHCHLSRSLRECLSGPTR